MEILIHKHMSDSTAQPTFQSLLLESLTEDDMNFILRRLAENGYAVFDINKLNQDLHGARQQVIAEISKKYILVGKEDWEKIKPIVDVYEQQQRTDTETHDNLSPGRGPDSTTRTPDGTGVSDITQANK